LHRFTMPACSRYAEDLVRASLFLPPTAPVQTRELRQAVLSACLCPLRQNVGSCFATAPAILIQREQIERLLLDLFDLVMTSRLVRTFDGEQHAAPISPNWGRGSLKEAKITDHALLKTWEYTIASFSDYKIAFYKWNLFTSLGFDSKEKGGIGELLFQKIQILLEETNTETEKHHQEIERAIDQLRVTETLLRQASSYDRVRQLKAQRSLQAHHAHACEDLRDRSHQKAKALSQFFRFLIEKYCSYFPQYFQEIYDAEMFEIETEFFEDAPAGFRLLYKHGRTDPTAWTLIHNEKEYIQALTSFFRATEAFLSAECEHDFEKEILTDLTTELLHHLGDQTFIDSAHVRIQKAHRALGDNGSAKEKKPWSYTSGGTLQTLLGCYFAKAQTFTEEKRVIHSPMELLVFLLDVMKGLPYNVTKAFEEDPMKGMLMYSPTHAFIFYPGLPFFKEGWQDKGFSYTWARDQVLLPSKNVFDAIRLSPNEQHHLAETFFQKTHLKVPFSSHGEALDLKAFRSYLLSYYPSSNSVVDQLDGFLRFAFSHIPAPCLFADTNWAHFFFGFTYNPGIGDLDLWRLDTSMQSGYPLAAWRPFLDGTDPKTWGVLTKPIEYSGQSLPDFTLLKHKV